MTASFFMTEIPFELVDIEGDGCHLIIDAQLCGHPIKMLIDTGASRTVFDKNRIAALIAPDMTDMDRLSSGLGTNTMSSQKAEITDLSIGEIVIPEYTAVILDLSHVNESYLRLGYSGIDAVLGGDLMTRFNAVIDYKEKTIKLS